MIRKKGDYVIFAQPYEGSPVDRAGIRIGDKILSIEGEDTKLGPRTDKFRPERHAQHHRPNRHRTVDRRRARHSHSDARTGSRFPASPTPGSSQKGSDISSTATSPKDRTKRCAPRSRNSAHRILRGLILDYRGNGRRHSAGSRQDRFYVRSQRYGGVRTKYYQLSSEKMEPRSSIQTRSSSSPPTTSPPISRDH